MTNTQDHKKYVYSIVKDGEEAKKRHEPDIVERCIGSMGRWQTFICVAIFCVKFPVAWHQLSILFIAPTPVVTCAENGTKSCWANCTSYEFDRSVFKETIITEWDLICDRAQLANVAQLTFMLGILLGNLLFGYLSDKFGRKTPLVCAVVVQVLTGSSAAFVPWFELFLVLRFLCAMATGGTMVTSFVLVMELVGTRWRTTLGVMYQIPFSLGHISLVGLSYLLRDWRHLQLCISIPSVILITYYWILPESPRWLLAVGRVDESIKVMENAAKHNRMEKSTVKDTVKKFAEGHISNDVNKHAGNIVDLVRSKNMCIKTLCICFNWVVCGLCFFGVAQFLGQVGGDIFLNVALSALITLPGTFAVMYMMQTWGRRYTLIISNILSGCSCLVIAVLPQNPGWLETLFGCLGMLGLSLSFPTVYIYSGELFPTVVRNIGVGTSSMSARIGSMIAPFVADLKGVRAWLPPVIFGVFPLIGAALCLILPETMNCKLPDTLEEAEEFGKAESKLKEVNHSYIPNNELELQTK